MSGRDPTHGPSGSVLQPRLLRPLRRGLPGRLEPPPRLDLRKTSQVRRENTHASIRYFRAIVCGLSQNKLIFLYRRVYETGQTGALKIVPFIKFYAGDPYIMGPYNKGPH